MRLSRCCVAMSLVAALGACTGGGDESPAAPTVHEPAPPEAVESTEATDPLAFFARLIAGQWRVGFGNQWSQIDRWRWGPGKHSIIGVTESSGGDGESTSGVRRVMYWHPGRKESRVLALTSSSRMSEGTVTIDGETVEFKVVFYERRLPGVRRPLSMRWDFDGPDKYRSALSEAAGSTPIAPMAEWDYARSMEVTEPDPWMAEAARIPSQRLSAVEPLLGRTFEADGAWASGESLHSRTTFERVPFADAISGRVIVPGGDGEPTDLLDITLYDHPPTDTVRVLALSDRGGVYEGSVTVLDGGGLQFDMTGFEEDRVIPLVVRLDFAADGTVRERVWSGEETTGTPLRDVEHRTSDATGG